MKHFAYFCFFLLFFSSCQNSERPSVKIISLANFTIKIDTSLSYQETNANLAMGKIIGKKISPIVLFNFGNKPISLQENIKRWKGQLAQTDNEKIETFHDELVYFVELEGLNKDKTKAYMLSVIIPSDHGPFYLKATCTKENYMETKKQLKKTLESIDY